MGTCRKWSWWHEQRLYMTSAIWFHFTKADVTTPAAECPTCQHCTEFLLHINLKGTSQVPGGKLINLEPLYHGGVSWLYNFSGISEYSRHGFAFTACSTSVSTTICDLTECFTIVVKFYADLLLIKGHFKTKKVWWLAYTYGIRCFIMHSITHKKCCPYTVE